MVYYLQSCSFPYGGGDERTNEKIRDYLDSKGVFICGCCHYSQKLFHEGDTVLFICSNCVEVTLENSPQVKVMGLYSWLVAQPDFPWPDYGGVEMNIQDAYGFHEFPQMQRDVRTCMERMNIKPVEIEERFEACNFDGPGRYALPSRRKRRMAPQRMARQAENVLPVPEGGIVPVMQEHARQYTTDQVVVYSGGSAKGVQLGGKQPVHLLKLITRDLP